MRFLGTADVLQRGFEVCKGLQSRNFDTHQEPTKNDLKTFKKHYESDPAALAQMWHDMGETILLKTDRVYGVKAKPDDHAKLALPNPCDNKLLGNFKARVRSRHESFNCRLKFFRFLSDTYHHDLEKHGHVFEAVAVTVQYQMDMGSKLFDA